MGESEYERLLGEAQDLVQVVDRQARRPYVVEITGTPKAGKSTSIQMLAGFFKQAGWKVHVLRERAALCPLVMKGHFFFNTWTTCTMLAELLDVVDSDNHLVILDRGLFDALIWLRLQQRRGQVAEDEATAFRDFVVLERWKSLQDATFLLTVDPEKAMCRENVDRLVPREGSLMAPAALAELNEVIESTVAQETDFSIKRIDASGDEQKRTVGRIIGGLLGDVRAWADPAVAVVPRSTVDSLFDSGRGIPWTDGETWNALSKDIFFETRSVAEGRTDLVQIVVAGVHTTSDGVFVFDRHDSKKREKYGRRALWKGAHVDHARETRVDEQQLRNALLQRLRGDLHLAALDVDPQPLGLVWEPSEERHLGVIFDVRIDNQVVANHLIDKSFKSRGRVHPLTVRFRDPKELEAQMEALDLESWSQIMLRQKWLQRK